MIIRPIVAEDAALVVSAWNQTLKHDHLSEQRFREVMLGDPNYEPEGVLLAEGDAGDVLAFSACVVRRDLRGKDGGGGEDNYDRAFLKGFFAVAGKEGTAAARELLARAEAFGAGAGKRAVTVTVYDGPYLFPGIDVRYQRLRRILERSGYQDTYTIECVATDLRSPKVDRMLGEVRATIPPDVTIATWDPAMLPAMREFVAEGEMPGWFPVGWESAYAAPAQTTLILSKGDEILAWAQFHPRRPRAGFGPILVLKRERGRNYGAVLLLESMVRSRKMGCRSMFAGWANTGFYVRYGWSIIRRFAVLRKGLQ
jgi:GNAT superfamily N-acetyltransferase